MTPYALLLAVGSNHGEAQPVDQAMDDDEVLLATSDEDDILAGPDAVMESSPAEPSTSSADSGGLNNLLLIYS